MCPLRTIFMASVGDIYGPKYMEKPALLNKLSHLDEYVVNGFLATLNKSDPAEIQKAIEMVCNNLSNRTNLPSETCDELLYGQALARSYRVGGDMAFTDVEVRGSGFFSSS